MSNEVDDSVVLKFREPPLIRSSRKLTTIAEEMGICPFTMLLHAVAGNYQAFGYDKPTIIKMSKDGVYEEEVLPVPLRLMAAKEAAQYLYPKKKAIEISGAEDATPVKMQYEGSIIDLINIARGKT